MDKIYLVKNLSPWMADEILAFSMVTRFRLILLRQPKDFLKTRLKEIEGNGIEIIYKPFKYNYIFKKIFFLTRFVFANFSSLLIAYSSVIGWKSVFWFLKLDLKLFSTVSSIHAQFATQPAIISLMLKKYFKDKINYSFTFHAYDIYFNNKWLKELINESYVSFSISEFNIQYVLNKYKGLNSSKIKLSRLGVFSPEEIKKENGYNEQLVIGFLSWFVEKKGIKYLMEAIKTIREKWQGDFRFILAGDGPLKAEMLDFVSDNNLQNVVSFTGMLDSNSKHKFYTAIDVFILPSIAVKNDQDGIPVVLMEAISYGLPIISTNISGIPEICIENFNGLLIEEKSIKQICESIRILSEDNLLLKQFSMNSLQVAQKYNIIDNSSEKLKYLSWT